MTESSLPSAFVALARTEAKFLLDFYEVSGNPLYIWAAMDKLLSARLPLTSACLTYLAESSKNVASLNHSVLRSSEQSDGMSQNKVLERESKASKAAQGHLLRALKLSSGTTTNLFKNLLHDNKMRAERNLAEVAKMRDQADESVREFYPVIPADHPSKKDENQRRAARRRVADGQKFFKART